MCNKKEDPKKTKCAGKCKLCKLRREIKSPDDLIKLDFLEWLSQNDLLKESEDKIWDLYNK